MLHAAAKAPSAHIYTFEPEPSNYVLVRKISKTNRLEQRVHAFNAGVSNNRQPDTVPCLQATPAGILYSIIRMQAPLQPSPAFSLERVFTDNSLPFVTF